MYGWMEHWAHLHAEELIEEAERHRLARGFWDARRNERPAGRSFVHGLVDLVRWGTLAKRPAGEEHLAK